MEFAIQICAVDKNPFLFPFFTTSRHLFSVYLLLDPFVIITHHHHHTIYVRVLSKNSPTYNDYAIFRLFFRFHNFSQSFFHLYPGKFVSEHFGEMLIVDLGFELVTNTICESKRMTRCLWYEKFGNIALSYFRLTNHFSSI